MPAKLFSTFLLVALLAFKSDTSYHAYKQTPPPNNFVKPVYSMLPLGSIRPKGWLLHQLQIMRDGSTGHLDETHAKLKNDNGWLGGKGDGWEETPYWLDGATPLAWLLDDTTLKQKVLRYINWTIDNQRPSGYFGPVTKWERETGKTISVETSDKGEDWWPKMIMLKVIQQYYTATKDKRVIPFMTKYFHYQLSAIKSSPLGKWTEWAQSRGTENMLVAQWLYSKTNDASLLELGAVISKQAFAWSKWLGERDWVMNAAAQQHNDNWMHRHGVNVAMGIKDPVINYQRTGDKQYLQVMKIGFKDLMSLHGLPMGVFSADEDLHGNLPTQGTELCAITEAMFSLEEMVAITGDVYYMDALERMTFNALPAQTTDDYNNKQYFQMANQVQISKGVFDFSLPFEREMNNVLGARSGYTCCLANMHQGWTKFAQNLWYQKGNGLAALEYSPCELNTIINNTKVSINEDTKFPFESEVNFKVTVDKPVAFPLELRIPSWCSEATILLNGKKLRSDKGGQVVSVNRTWTTGDKLTLDLPMQVTTSNWGRNSRSIERGPLVYALKLEEKWERATDEKEGDYFSVYPKSDWNFGLTEAVIKEPLQRTEVTKVKEVTGEFIWNISNAPIEIKTTAKQIPAWKAVNGVAHQPVTDRSGVYRGKVDDKEEKITLIPYGCTKVRIVAFPVVP